MKKLFFTVITLLVAACLSIGCNLEKDPLSQNRGKEIVPAEGNVIGYVNGMAVECQLINGDLIYQGDILAAETPPADSNRGCGSMQNLWSNAIIPYVVDKNFTNTAVLDTAIQNYLLLGIYWAPRQNQAAYVHFRNSTENSSYVGRQGGKQYINIFNYHVGVLMHEMGHALGLYHEQSRADRSAYITMYPNNMKDTNDINYALENGSKDFWYYRFDWKSIMLYNSIEPTFAKDPTKPIYTKLDGTEVRAQLEGLSAGDIGTLHIMYPQNDTPIYTTPLSRADGTIDIFYLNSDCRVTTTAWHSSLMGWKKPWLVKSSTANPGAPVSAVARSVNNLDLFSINTSGNVVTAAWDPANNWGGWWRIGDLVINSRNNKISAVSRSSNMLDIFVIDNEGRVMSAAWQSGVAGSKWRGWWQINNGIAAAGTQVEALSIAQDQLDLFIVGDEGNVLANRWKASNGWTGWASMGAPGNVVTLTAVASGETRIHLFAVCTNGQVYSLQMPGVRAGWTGWKRIGNLVVAPGAKVAAVSRQLGFVDVFVQDRNNKVQSAAWQKGYDSDNTYRGWWQVDSGIWWATQLSVVSMNANHLAVFHADVNHEIHQATWTPSYGWKTGVVLPK